MCITPDGLKDLSDGLDMIRINEKRKLHRQIPKSLREEKVITFVDEFFSKIRPCIKQIRKRILKVSIYNTIVGSFILIGSIYYNLPILYSFFGFSLVIMSINGIIIGVK